MKTHERTDRAAAAFEARAARAELLATTSQAAAEPLRFAAGSLRAQGAVANAIEDLHAASPFSGRIDEDFARIVDLLQQVTRFAACNAPSRLAEEARARAGEDAARTEERLKVFWNGDRSSADDYLSRAVLRPYVETLRRIGVIVTRRRARGCCPACGGAPQIACRRGGADGEGATRELACALCGCEWPIRRIFCPACFENDPRKLPSFASEAHPIVRLETCETCGRYLKSLDLSRDARPIPEVDDLTSLALDLWAVEQGYQRIEPGLAGV